MLRFGIVATCVASLVLLAACSDEETSNDEAAAGSAGMAPGAGGAGTTTPGGAGDASDGVAGGPSSGSAGEGGAASCTISDCEGLNESDCVALTQSAARTGCIPVYGTVWPNEPSGEAQYAGCATECCGDECESHPDAEACVADKLGKCWTISSPPAPAGWELLSVVKGCDEFPECAE
jgi:hypothetical protein